MSLIHRFFLFVLLAALSGAATAQPIEWAKIYHTPPPPNGPATIGSSGLYNAVAHPNGGVLAAGNANTVTIWNSSYAGYGAVAMRISSTGDSLGAFRLPGMAGEGISSHPPIIVGLDPFSSASGFVAICARDSIDQVHPTHELGNYLAWLDSTGRCTDSLELSTLVNNPRPEAAAFLTRTKIVWAGNGQAYDVAGGYFYQTIDLSCVQLPAGNTVWQRRYRVNDYDNAFGSMVVQPNGKLWLLGSAGSHAVLLKVDSTGTQYGGQDLFEAANGSTVYLDGALSLTGGRLAMLLGYYDDPAHPNTTHVTTALRVTDTLGSLEWECLRHSSSFGQGITFVKLLTANDDGGFSYLYAEEETTTPIGLYMRPLSVWRRAADSTVLGYWYMTTMGSGPGFYMYMTPPPGICYKGDGSAYLLSRGKDYDNLSAGAGYFIAKLGDFGQPYIPTAIAGPREKVSALSVSLYPNPATDRLNVSSDKEMGYRILTSTGALVMEGRVSRSRPVELAGLAPGLYQIVLTDRGQSALKRFVKQ